MARHYPHDRLPHCRRMTLLDVVADETGVSRRSVQTLGQIFEEDGDEHGTDRHPHDCQAVCRWRLLGHSGDVTAHWGCDRRHREPRPKDAIPDRKYSQAEMLAARPKVE